MNDVVVLLGLPLFSLTAPAFVVAGALAIFGYERAEARARSEGDAGWLLGSLALAVVLGLVLELRPADGFRGVAWIVLRAVVGCGAVGLGELVLLVVRRAGAASRPYAAPEKGATRALRGTMFATPRWPDRSLSSLPASRLVSRSSARSWPRALRASSRGSATTAARAARPAP
jgi:hypothetical protein